jgi:endoglucanase
LNESYVTAPGQAKISQLPQVLPRLPDKDVNLGDKLTITSLNTSGTHGSATIDAKTGEIDYNPNGAFDYLSVGKTATDYFNYTISDGHGGVSTNWVTVTISGVNVAPTARPGTASVAAYGGVWVNALSFDSDINSSDTLSIVGLNTAGTKGTATLNPSATNGFEYNTGSAFDYLSAGETATDTVQYTVSDNHGATTTGTVTITVSGVNVAPVAHADSASTVSNQAVTVNVLANDTDINTDDHLTVTSLNTSGTAGNVTIAANGTSVIYTPEGADAALTYGQSATDKFSYTVSDGHGGTSTASVTVSITGPAPTISDLLGSGYLSTDGSQYINAAGQVVRIVATGWDGGDTQNFVPTDLYAVNYQATMREMVSAGFNTIRIPWSDALLHASPAAGSINYSLNPTLQGLNSVQVMQQIVNYAGQIGLKIIFDHHNDEGNSGTQGNGLWYDVGGASNNTDGSGDAGTVSQATFLSDWKTFASLWAGNSTVIGFDLDNEPNHATWTGPSTTSVLTMSEQVGDALQAIDPGALIIVEAPASNNAPEGDLSVVAANPVVLNVADKLVYSVHEYPQSVNGQTFSGNTAQYIQQMNAAWGYLVADNTAPVWIGEMGSSLATASDQLWAQTLVDYMNGDYAAEGGPGVTGNEQGVSGDWWGWYSTNGSPDGLLQSDYTDLKQNQYAIVQQIGETPVGGAQGSSLIGTTSTISNSLILNMQEDAYNGNAEFTVSVDGVQVGGVQTVTATRSSNVIQQFFLSGNFAAGSHTVTVTFLNDAYGGTTTTDRNLFVKGITFDGVTQTVTNGSLFNNGSVSVPIAASGTVTTVTAPDSLILQLSTTSGGDTFAVYIDGQQAGGDLTLTGGGGVQTFSLIQDLGGGSHQIDIRQLDAVSGNSTIAVSTLDYDGTQQSITATNAAGTMDQDFTVSSASVLTGGTISLGNDTADVVVTQPNQMVFLAAGTHAVESDGTGFTLNVAGGSATLTDFNTATDHIDLMGGIGGYAVVSQAVAAIVSDGHGGASLALGGGSLDFVGVAPSSLTTKVFTLS